MKFMLPSVDDDGLKKESSRGGPHALAHSSCLRSLSLLPLQSSGIILCAAGGTSCIQTYSNWLWKLCMKFSCWKGSLCHGCRNGWTDYKTWANNRVGNDVPQKQKYHFWMEAEVSVGSSEAHTEAVIVLGFLVCALNAVLPWDSQHCRWGWHEPCQVGRCPSCSERQNLNSEVASLNSQTKTFNMESLSVPVWV